MKAWRLGIAVLTGVAVGQLTPTAWAQTERAANAAPAVETVIDEAAASQWITDLVRTHLPHEYEDTRDWGSTKRVLDGWDIRREGLQLKTKRRWKQVPHGTWKKYRVQLLNPQEHFHLTVANLRRLENENVAFDLHADAWLGVSGRVTEYAYDVQLYSFSAEGVGQVRISLQCEVAMRLDPRKLPPDLVLAPKVNAAEARLETFRLDRISKVDGSLAEEIGRSMRRVVQDKLADDNPKLADKLNRQIAKNQDKLRLSLHDALRSKWGAWVDDKALEESPPSASEPLAP